MSNAHYFRFFQAAHDGLGLKDRRHRQRRTLRQDITRRLRCERLEDRTLLSVLTVANITAASKTYDGGAAATLNTGSAALVGVNSGDNVTLVTTGATGAFADKNVGTGKTVTISGLSLSGTDAGNYTLVEPTVSADITPQSIIVTAAANNKVYDGTTTAGAVPTITSGSLASGDTASFSETYDTKNVGAGKTLTPTGTVSDGDGGNDYTVTFAPAASGVITTRTLTVTATASDKVYDGTTTATVTLSDNRVSGDTLTDSDTAAAFSDANVGAGKTVTVSGIAISGADAANYVLSSTTATTTASITALMNSEITGFVYCDNDEDGILTPHATVPHVTVTLEYQDALGGWLNWTTNPYQQTNDQGGYVFSDLPAGNYRVTMTQPAAFTDAGTIDPHTQSVTLAASATTTVNFGVGPLQTQYLSWDLLTSSPPTLSQIVAGLDAPPAVDLNGTAAAGTGTSVKFYSGGSAVAIAPSGSISDSDSATLASLTVKITNLHDGAAEVLDATVTGTSITKNYSNGVLTLSGIAPVADYVTVLDSITYDDTATAPSAPTVARIVTFVASDGIASSAAAQASVIDPPAPAAAAAVNGTSIAQNAAAASPAMSAVPQAAVVEAAAATSAASAATVVRSGSDVTVTGTAGDDNFQFIAGATANTVIVQGQSYVFAAGDVTTFHFNGNGGSDTAKLTAAGLASLAETAQLQPGSASLQGGGYSVEVSNVSDVEIDGRGTGVQAALFDSPGDDSLTAQGDVVSLAGNGFIETVSGFQRVQASAVAGGRDTLREVAFDGVLETVGNWIDPL